MSQGMPGLRSSDPGKRLGIYLSDHLAGSRAGLELARRAASSNRGNEFGPVLGELAQEIDEDIDSLEELMARFGVRRDPLKETLAWTTEKLGRLKLNGQLVGYSPLSRLVELEALSLGVAGKLALWEALEATVAADPRLEGFDLARLAARARSQRERLERQHVAAAKVALGDTVGRPA
jgi:hypothetical protein